MKTETFSIIGKKGEKLFAYRWLPEIEPVAIVLISHGMVETVERYGRLAERLTQEGYGVYGIDHLGHGRTANTIDEIGVLGKNDFPIMVDTLEALRIQACEENPDKKVFLLGHSMGSFLSQTYIQKYGNTIDGVILSGTSGKTPGLRGLKTFVDLVTLIHGKNTRAKLLDAIQFGGYNKKFRPNRTAFDWLNRDEKEVDAYIDNPYCGMIVTYSFFQCLVNGSMAMHRKRNMKDVPITLPIYIFSGTKDPVGEFTKTVSWLIEEYKKIGILDVSHRFYEGGRHEMINELNRDEVAKDLIKWLDQHN